ncbi:uncharacterized protein EKO05_0005851 [Ascochyta rabiei]|uniref:Uncharacterized protein n=1 Tax=Didymella rabiei TaxID=5454 RepID=A0A163IZQ9_DIDRA|nr:uncharacterized protein EKO05_0005851 [Ascochyta rabiei]KZM26050.1 hypothetical protein ST47_g2793 [Ascochyta rabiei]UPX15404.1 hypothetical protein EKO05_0005851 [Ascochyta rabiei]
MGPTPPRTPTARKSLPGSPSATTPNATALGSPIVIQKRKWQGDNVPLPLQGLTQPEDEGESAPVAQMTPTKRRRSEDEIKVEPQYRAMPAAPLPTQSFAQNPAAFPSRPPQSQQHTLRLAYPDDWRQRIFMNALQSNQNLIPGNVATTTMTSQHIDRFANAMWQVVFNHENTMRDVTARSAMFSTLKLRALARLNYLPSWWHLREMACIVMMRMKWIIDDSEMQGLWMETVEWCGRVETKMGIHTDGAGVPKQHDEDDAQEGVGKVES